MIRNNALSPLRVWERRWPRSTSTWSATTLPRKSKNKRMLIKPLHNKPNMLSGRYKKIERPTRTSIANPSSAKCRRSSGFLIRYKSWSSVTWSRRVERRIILQVSRSLGRHATSLINTTTSKGRAGLIWGRLTSRKMRSMTSRWCWEYLYQSITEERVLVEAETPCFGKSSALVSLKHSWLLRVWNEATMAGVICPQSHPIWHKRGHQISLLLWSRATLSSMTRTQAPSVTIANWCLITHMPQIYLDRVTARILTNQLRARLLDLPELA